MLQLWKFLYINWSQEYLRLMVKVSHTVLSIGIILDYKGLTLHLWLTTIRSSFCNWCCQGWLSQLCFSLHVHFGLSLGFKCESSLFHMCSHLLELVSPGICVSWKNHSGSSGETNLYMHIFVPFHIMAAKKAGSKCRRIIVSIRTIWVSLKPGL